MATEYPPLGKSYVVSYANNDRDFPIIGIRKDPRVDNYKIPEDLSPHPDSVRYPNHVFTGANPTNSDERVLWIYEILPAPWVPFARYDDDLGPVQGRRRAVKNEGQKASLTASTKRTYEGRDGSAIVLNEIEETWSIATDDDGNSLFPLKTRDFYDASRGPVQETRQIFVPTGEEQGSLENVNGTITQISYEPYNEYLSVKIVQTYSVDGPQLIGQATDGDGQLVTVTTQRKGSDGYTPPQPTAIKTVEVSREDAESLVERIVDKPLLFDGKILSASKPDVIPERFRASIPNETTVEIKEGSSVTTPSLGEGEFEKTVQRQNVHSVKETTTSRNPVFLEDELSGIDYEELFDLGIPFVERIATTIESGLSADIAPLGDGKYLVREYNKDEIEPSLESFYEKYPTRTNLNLPTILKSIKIGWDKSETTGEQINDSSYSGAFNSITLGDNGQNSAEISVTPKFNVQLEEINGTNLFTDTHLFFLRGPVTIEKILDRCGAFASWPIFKTKSYLFTSNGAKVSALVDASYSMRIDANPSGTITNTNKQFSQSRSITNVVLNIPPCIHGNLVCKDANNSNSETATATASVFLNIPYIGSLGPYNKTISETVTVDIQLNQTSPPDIPRSGIYLIDSTIDPYKYGFFLVRAVTIDASNFA